MNNEAIDNFETYLEKKTGVIPFHYEPCEIGKEEFFEILLNNNNNEVVIKEICHGVRALLKNSIRHLSDKIIFEGKSFSIDDIDLITELLTYKRGGGRSCKYVFFINCKFRIPLSIDNLNGTTSFFNCVFLRDFNITGVVTQALNFCDCNFKGNLNLSGTEVNGHFVIQNCFFDTKSSLIIKKSVFTNRALFCLENTPFFGAFDAENARLGKYLFRNIAFFNKFNFDKVIFGNERLFGFRFAFENIAFANPRSKKSMKMQAIFTKALEKNGLPQVIFDLGLSTSISSNNSSEAEDKEYQDALKKGWLNPKQAARFLGKSVRTLQEKRKKDKEHITRETLPFIGEGKDIVYPLDALKAYLAQDWNLLKELRKKHWKKD